MKNETLCQKGRTQCFPKSSYNRSDFDRKGLTSTESTLIITGLLDHINKLELAIYYENKNPRPNSHYYLQSLHDDIATIKNMLEAFNNEKRL